jgi:hypothetical protein
VFGSVHNECVAVGAKVEFEMTDRPNPSTQSSWQAILPLALLYALVNLFAFRLGQWVSEVFEWWSWRQRFWSNTAVAFTASEVVVLSMVLVFAPGRFIQRLALYWGAGTLLGACWLIGIGISPVAFPDRLTGEDVTLSLPLAALVSQAPLWLLRVCFGWRWQREPDTLANSEVHWSLKDLLAGTALIALSLSLARLVEHDRGFWTAWIEISTYAFFISLFTVGPAMVLTLRGWSWQFGVLVFLVCVTLAGEFYIGIRQGVGWGPPPMLLLVFLLPLLSFAAGLLLATLVARWLGYRLVWGHRGRALVAQTPRS